MSGPALGALDGEGPVYLQIRRAVARPILTGDWRPGARVPSEQELTALYGASRMTVNRALTSLAEEGLIVRRRRAGSFVAPRAAERSVMEIWDIAAEVERAGRSYRFELIDAAARPADAETARMLGVAPGTVTVETLGLHRADGRPVQIERRLINAGAVPQAAEADFSQAPPGRWLLDHVPWSQAEHVIRAINADAETARLLEIAEGAACLVVERRTWAQGEPITVAELVSPGDSRSLVGRFTPPGGEPG